MVGHFFLKTPNAPILNFHLILIYRHSLFWDFKCDLSAFYTGRTVEVILSKIKPTEVLKICKYLTNNTLIPFVVIYCHLISFKFLY